MSPSFLRAGTETRSSGSVWTETQSSSAWWSSSSSSSYDRRANTDPDRDQKSPRRRRRRHRHHPFENGSCRCHPRRILSTRVAQYLLSPMLFQQPQRNRPRGGGNLVRLTQAIGHGSVVVVLVWTLLLWYLCLVNHVRILGSWWQHRHDRDRPMIETDPTRWSQLAWDRPTPAWRAWSWSSLPIVASPVKAVVDSTVEPPKLRHRVLSPPFGDHDQHPPLGEDPSTRVAGTPVPEPLRHALAPMAPDAVTTPRITTDASRVVPERMIVPPPNRDSWAPDPVHVITTRFMQFQPTLLELGLARLALFRAITVPSLRHQQQPAPVPPGPPRPGRPSNATTPDFLWIIRTDPELHPTLLAGLIDAVHDLPNVILLRSNDNPEGFREHGAPPPIFSPSDLPPRDSPDHHHRQRHSPLVGDPIAFGSRDFWQHTHDRSKSSVVLETRLDADDAVHVHFVSRLRSFALDRQQRHLLPTDRDQNPPRHSRKWWVILCAGFHWEWHPYSPWEEEIREPGDRTVNTTAATIDASRRSPEVNITLTQNHSGEANRSPPAYGALLGQSATMCVTAGLTFLYGVHTTRSDIPVSSAHHKLHTVLPACHDDADIHQLEARNDGQTSSNSILNPCLARFDMDGESRMPSVLRARSISSAGMKQVLLSPDTSAASHSKPSMLDNVWRPKQELMRSVLERWFGVQTDDLFRVRSYLDEHQVAIAKDNLNGQCTPGHSCKKGVKKLLKKLLTTNQNHTFDRAAKHTT